MYRSILAIAVACFVGLISVGCNKSRKEYYQSTAPVTTYSVVFVDTFGDEDRIEIINSVAAIFSEMLADYPTTITNNNIEYHVTITNNIVNIRINGNKNFLSWCGDYNECPNLYEAFCRARFGDDHPDRPRWKNKGKQVEEDCKRKSRKNR